MKQSQTPEEKFDFILNSISNCTNKFQLDNLQNMAQEHFKERASIPDLFNQVIGAIKLKKILIGEVEQIADDPYVHP